MTTVPPSGEEIADELGRHDLDGRLKATENGDGGREGLAKCFDHDDQAGGADSGEEEVEQVVHCADPGQVVGDSS